MQKSVFLRNTVNITFVIFSFWFAIIQIKTLHAQTPTVQDCLGAIPICQDVYVEPSPYAYNGLNGTYPNEIYGFTGYNCITPENNGVWYSFTAATSGALRFSITGDNPYDDYDWIVFDMTFAKCSDLRTSAMYAYMVSSNNYGAYYNLQPVTGANSYFSGGTAGNCNGPGEENGPIWNDDIPVVAGHNYVLYNSNWSGSNYGYTIDFSASQASIYDDIDPIITQVETPEDCTNLSLKITFSEPVSCASVSTSDFSITDASGNLVNITEITSTACSIGIPYSDEYIIHFNGEITVGTCRIDIHPHTDVSVIDKCGNRAVTESIYSEINSFGNIIISTSPVSCHDGSDGRISVTTDIEADLTYSLNNTSVFIDNGGLFEGLTAGTYIVYTKKSENCIIEQTVILANPPGVILNAGQDITLCNSASATLNATASPVGVGVWHCADNSITIHSPESVNTTISNISIGTTELIWTIDAGVCGTFSDILVLINSELPSDAKAGDDRMLCSETGSLNAQAPEFGTGFWTTNTSVVISNPNSYNSEVQNLAVGNNLFFWTVSNGICPNNRDTISIFRYQKPTAQAESDKIICDNFTSISAVAPNVGFGSWMQFGSAVIDNNITPNTTVSNLEKGENLFTWTVTNGVCPPASDDVLITVGDFEPPVPDSLILPDVFAKCETSILPPTATDNCSGKLQGTSSVPLYFDRQGIYILEWIFEDEEGMQAAQYQTITIEDDEFPNIVCPIDTVVFLTIREDFHTISNDEFLPKHKSDNCGIENFLNNYNFSQNLNDEIFEIGVTQVEWTILDVNGNETKCVCDIKVTDFPPPEICPECGIFIPDAFSPNGSGKNDVFKIIGLRNFPENSIVIYNRWGNKVFEAAPYDTPWDGSNLFGTTVGKREILPDGTYFYILRLNDSIKPISGYVYLKR